MQVSPIHSSKFNNVIQKNIVKHTNPINNTEINKGLKHGSLKRKLIFPALLASVISLFSATCSNIRGGNFIYNNQTQKIEKFNKLDINDMEYCKTNDYGLYNCHDKNYIKSVGVDKWIEENKDKLNGSCYFMKDDTLISKGIRLFTTQSGCNKYVPSHATPIYKDSEGNIKLLQILSPNVFSTDLADFLKNTDEDYMIFIRDFDINEERFSENCKNEIGKPYGMFSAIQAVTNLFDVDAGLHCSEGYVNLLQKEGMFKGVNSNKITPNTLMYLLVNNHANKNSTTF